MEIAERTFLVTGGGSGLGEACARRLAECGARVVVADIDEPRGEAVASTLGEVARFVHADVTETDDVCAAIDACEALSRGDGLRGLIHCAGVATGAKVLHEGTPHALEAFADAVRVNLIGTFNADRLAAAAMAPTLPLANGERGVIINTVSVAAFEGQIGQAAYSASKGGVASMTLPMARELARHGIRVTAIAPGVFETPMVASMPEKVRAGLAQHTVFPSRLGQVDEFASLVEEIIRNSMLNGSVIRLDGAVRMPPR